MNKKMAYEQTIAGKLEGIAVPDMADAIWARIELQLDTDMPRDDAAGDGSLSFPSGGIFLGGISLIVVAVLYLLFSQTKNNKPENTLPVPAAPNTTQGISTPQPTPTESVQPYNNSAGNNTLPATASPPAILYDSTVTFNLPPPLQRDTPTTAERFGPAITVAPKVLDTLPPAKKGRGMKGLTDDDYRIVPKKDSINN